MKKYIYFHFKHGITFAWSYRQYIDLAYVRGPFKTLGEAKKEARKYLDENKLTADERANELYYLRVAKLSDVEQFVDAIGPEEVA